MLAGFAAELLLQQSANVVSLLAVSRCNLTTFVRFTSAHNAHQLGASVWRHFTKRTHSLYQLQVSHCVDRAPSKSLDFEHDALGNGRRIKCLDNIEDYTRERLTIEVNTSTGGERMTRVLDRLVKTFGKPYSTVMEHGPEMTDNIYAALRSAFQLSSSDVPVQDEQRQLAERLQSGLK